MKTKTLGLTLARLPLAGQRVLAKHPDEDIRQTLARSPLLHADIVDMLATDATFDVRCAVVGRTKNQKTLLEVLDKSVCQTADGYKLTYLEHGLQTGTRNDFIEAVANPLTPPKLLTEILVQASRDKTFLPGLTIRAGINQNTPEKAQRQYLTPEIVYTITGKDYDTDLHHAIAGELVLANPWMTENPTIWGAKIQRAMCGLPEVSKETLETLGERSERCQHPAWHGRDLETMTINQLVQTQTVAGDICALGRSDFGTEHAEQIMNRKIAPAAHVIARLINRFGVYQIKTRNRRGNHMSERCLGAQYFAPVQRYAGLGQDITNLWDMQEAIRILDSRDSNQWITFIALLQDWHGTYTQAALAARRL